MVSNRSAIRKFVLPLIVMLGLAGCKEEYYPSIDRQMEALVVEGLITDLREPYTVKLTMATAYDSTLKSEGIVGASVSIADDLGFVYQMHEDKYLKQYYSDPLEFVGVAGRSYTLHITMPNGDIYESAAQKLLPPAVTDSIHGITTNKEYWYVDPLGKIVSKMVYGSETFMDIGYSSDSVYQFRFDSYLVKCYSYMDMFTPEMRASGITFPPPIHCQGSVCPYLIYNWKRFDLKTNIKLSVNTHTISFKKIINSTVCFFSFDTSSFRIVSKKDSCGFDTLGHYRCATIRMPAGPEGKALQTRLYSLNKTSSLYYQQLNKQLSSEGKLFDPIAVQLQGNIKCISNPDKRVLGLFEVSSCTTGSYWLTFDYGGGEVQYRKVIDLSALPDSGSSKYKPDFWLP